MMNSATILLSVIALLLVVFVAASCGGGSSAGDAKKQRVISFVKEAAAYAKANGRKKACEAFNNPLGNFVRGAMYIYAYDMSGVELANGANRELVGKNLIDLTDPNGMKVVQEHVDAAKRGGGWMRYTWKNPATGKNATKLGYVLPVDGTWLVGSGYYLDSDSGNN